MIGLLVFMKIANKKWLNGYEVWPNTGQNCLLDSECQKIHIWSLITDCSYPRKKYPKITVLSPGSRPCISMVTV